MVTFQIVFDLLFVGVAVRVFVGAAKLRVNEKADEPDDTRAGRVSRAMRTASSRSAAASFW